MIPYSTQDITKRDIRAVSKALTSGWLTQGPAVAAFEKALAKKVKAKYAVAFNSGTAALHAAYFAAGIRAGDEVVVPSLTFAATANAALYLGARPVFADTEPDTGLMSVADAERRITKKTKALVPVDYAGHPVDLHGFRALAKKRGLVLIEDAAQSLGASYAGKPVGAMADMTMFSFHPVKSITTGEGGAITTNNATYAAALRLFRTHGITKDTAHFERKNAPRWYQEMQELGFNYRMPEMNAALGVSQLERLERYIERRRALAKRYDELLEGDARFILPPPDTRTERSAWHLYPLRLSQSLARRRDEVLTKLREAGIGAQVHHVPVHTHPYYERLGYESSLCPNTRAFVDAEISLPLFPALTQKQQNYIVGQLVKAL